MLICPESPRWLLVNGRSGEAISVLNHMAKINGASKLIPYDAQFVEDPTAFVEAESSAEGEKNKLSQQDRATANHSQMQLSRKESVLQWDNCVAVDPSHLSEELLEPDSFHSIGKTFSAGCVFFTLLILAVTQMV